uniref:Uncharacterized protein n=1 Tax=Erwinia amylovora ATCC BAA-2158 TaxID=889211 RepID=E5B6E6_ERWAM|nr:hypothetical protein predicted by Glimmer/Critica [Erwinia amylovora ATCC BAA-2158]
MPAKASKNLLQTARARVKPCFIVLLPGWPVQLALNVSQFLFGPAAFGTAFLPGQQATDGQKTARYGY